MTLGEFKAWFEGFSEGIESKPSAEQWKKIRAKVAKIDDVPTTRTIFVDHYIKRYLEPYWTCRSGSITSSDTLSYNSGENGGAPSMTQAFRALGRAESAA